MYIFVVALKELIEFIYILQQPRSLLQGQMYPYQTNPQLPTVATYTPAYPPHPGVVLKSLPFFDKLGDLVQPSSLSKYSTSFMFIGGFYFQVP